MFFVMYSISKKFLLFVRRVVKLRACVQSEERSDEMSDRRSSSSDGRRLSRVSVVISHDKYCCPHI